MIGQLLRQPGDLRQDFACPSPPSDWFFYVVPKLQEWLSLVGDAAEAPPVRQDWACIATCLNQSAQATAQLARAIAFEVDGDRAVCRLPGIEFRVDFGARSVRLVER